ncbi:MAG: D-glycerate dehydrogenase [Candidatus Heimdallarchaeota archaeon]|nr:D-glycerate dehydrogenase [Candidatus Heimdallarchaeota archaeon]
MQKKIFVTREIPQIGIDILLQYYEVDIFPKKRPITKEEMISGAMDCDGLLPLLTDKVDAEVMDETGIKAIANYAVGVDNIDVAAASQRNIAVTNTPGVLTDATADLTWALLLSVSRRIVEADKYLREGNFLGWDSMLYLGGDFAGRTIGIIGLGRIGQAVARRAAGFDMNIIYHSTSPHPNLERSLGMKRVSLEELLKESDYVSIHTPYNKETHHLIGKKELEIMKPSAYLINTSRGKIVNEEELVVALVTGKIDGAGLDVYYHEPKVHKGLIDLPNVVLLPHLGSASMYTRSKMAMMAAENLHMALSGERPENIVNPEIYDK